MKKTAVAGVALGRLASPSAARPARRSRSASPARSPARTPPSARSSRTAPSRPSRTSTPPAASTARRSSSSVGDDVSDPKQGVSVANKFVGRRRQVRRRPLQLRRLHPGLGSLCRERHPRDHAGRDQPEVHRARPVEHVPHLRPRRPAGRGRRQVSRRQLQGQEGRRRPRQDPLRPGPRRRDQEGDERRRREGSPLRRRQRRREGLLGARSPR